MIHAGPLTADFPADFYLTGYPLFYLCFDPADSPGPQRHWPWEPSFGVSRLSKFGQGRKWKFCSPAALRWL
jgi:hypothetical protein